MKRSRFILWIAIAAAVVTGSPAFAPSGTAGVAKAAESPTQREYAVKAAFIYNFVQFVEWPADAFADANSPIVVATVGGDPFQGALEKVMQNKSVGGRSLIVKQFKRAADIRGCHVLFIASSSSADMSSVVSQVDGGPVLLVGESERFLSNGGMIRFFQEEKKLRFEISPRAAERVRLRISSKLLKLAKIFNG